ncbi:MAG: hypothetical protein JEY71_05715 [Sphaerochaeta sp.]|nr:hypothetical protein [Sphaerochaeta sp.]
MKKEKYYLQEAKDEIISKFRQSGLSKSKFCELPEVPITTATLSKWLDRDGSNNWEEPGAKRETPASPDLNIVCYNIGDNKAKEENGQEPTLQQMIRFQQDMYALCSHLYRLPCDKASIRLLSHIREVL